jgi:hypothetical protein
MGHRAPRRSSAAPTVRRGYRLGRRENWLIGCSDGFASACSPALQPGIACLKRVGASSRSGVTEADVESCASTVDAGLARTATG